MKKINHKVTKAIIPIAGRGTRFLPVTKAVPKELIPIINIPMIYYVIEEAVQSGIEQIIFISSQEKDRVLDYFDRDHLLESFLKEKNKHSEFEQVLNIGSMVDVVSVRQKEPLGLGHAILQAKHLIGKDERFAVILPDDLVIQQTQQSIQATRQLIEVSDNCDGESVIGVMQVSSHDISKYGIVEGDEVASKTWKMTKMLEKPQPGTTNSTLACPGRYILQQQIMDELETIPKGAGGEFQLTDAIYQLSQKRLVYAHEFSGMRFDTGSIPGYLDAVAFFALSDNKYKSQFLASVEKYQNIGK